MSAGLPTGWASTRVGDLFETHGGGTPNRATSAYWNGDIPWLSSGDIKGTGICESSETITRRGLEESAARLCRKGSVVVVVRSGILKHTLPVALLEREAAINQDLKAFDSGDEQLNSWLALAWRATARELLANNREGTTVQSVKLQTLQEFELPIPPSGEQVKILAKVENLSDKIETCRERLTKIPFLLKRFRQSVRAAACSGRLTADWREENPSKMSSTNERSEANSDDLDLPSSWTTTSLQPLLQKDRGISYGVLKPGPHVKGGVRLVKSSQVQLGKVDLTEDYRISAQLDIEYTRTKLLGGEVLLNVVGSVGRAAIAPMELAGANVSRAIAVVPVAENYSRWIVLCFLSPALQQLMSERTGGTAQPVLNLGEVQKMTFPLPPLAERQEIVRRVEALFALADQIEARYAKAKAHVEKLTQSILAKAFRGELVPQDPNDEPASVLLERIRANRGLVSRSRTNRIHLSGKNRAKP
jgi:type I restriction enzyme S subunit